MNRFGLPNLGFGMGLRTPHYATIFAKKPKVDWFEVISENFIDSRGLPRQNLERILANYPVVMHGVSLSIGSTDPLNREYLKKLKALAEWVNPPWISDHLCWTGVKHHNSHDLLPVPYTKEALKHVVSRIKKVQDFLGRPILMENPSTYLEFSASSIPEWEFIAKMAGQADCGLLLDANNVYVACYNHGYDPKAYIDTIPADRVVQIHLAGHDNHGTHIIDTHGGHVIDEVWKLYRYIISRTGPVSTMVEWDANIPAFEVVYKEVQKAKQFATKAAPNNLPSFEMPKPDFIAPPKQPLERTMGVMMDHILSGDTKAKTIQRWIRPKEKLSEKKQLAIYADGYRFRLFDAVAEDFPVLKTYLGKKTFNALLDAFIGAEPSQEYNLAEYSKKFPAFVARRQTSKIAGEIAMLEAAHLRVFDADPSPVLDPSRLANLSPEEFLSLALMPQASSELLSFSHNIPSYFEAVKEGKKPPKIKAQTNQAILFCNENHLWLMPLEKSEYLLLSELKEGKKLGRALESVIKKTRMSEEALSEKFQGWFAEWIRRGVISISSKQRQKAA